MFGYMGKILRVDLTSGNISEESTREEDRKMFLGGSGLATKYLFDEVPKGADPLGPDNELIFMTGPLTGTESPSAGRYCVVTKSPLTGFWGEANSGGNWGVYLKISGFDGIIFKGISPKPVYLLIDDGKAELRDAKHLWGKGVSETDRLIKEELGEDCNVATIGIGDFDMNGYSTLKGIGRGLFVKPATLNEVMSNPDTQFLQGYIEESNVEPVHTMVNMIELFREFELGQKAIQIQDQSLQRVITEVGTVR